MDALDCGIETTVMNCLVRLTHNNTHDTSVLALTTARAVCSGTLAYTLPSLTLPAVVAAEALGVQTRDPIVHGPRPGYLLCPSDSLTQMGQAPTACLSQTVTDTVTLFFFKSQGSFNIQNNKLFACL